MSKDTTNVSRLLEVKKVPFEIRSFDVTEEHLDAAEVARAIGEPPERVFKTLVTEAPGPKYFVFCVSAVLGLDLKKAAQAAGAKRVEMLHLSKLTAVTGYQRGGCSPLGMKRNYPTFIDESALLFDRIWMSAGQRGCQVGVAVSDLLALGEGRIQMAELT